MIPYGTLLNVLLVILGGTIGIFTKKIISSHLQKKIFIALGLFTIIIGFSMCFNFQNYIVVILSIILGSKVGHYLNLDLVIKNLTKNLKEKFKINSNNFTEGILTSFLLFCIGSMTIVGSIEEGLGKSPTILYTKSVMDGVSSILLSSIFGVGVIFSVFPMIIFQVSITLLTFYFRDFIPNQLISDIESVGGIVIIVMGLNILGLKKVKAINLLPSLIFVVFIYMAKSTFV
tara:strand:+ start:2451 stop:3143 length:693 start_codon:yes stop_codon:yes gene_type:complete